MTSCRVNTLKYVDIMFHTHTHTHTHTYIYICRVNTLKYVDIMFHTHTHTHTHIYIYIYAESTRSSTWILCFAPWTARILVKAQNRWVTWLPVDWWSKCKTGEWRGCLWIDGQSAKQVSDVGACGLMVKAQDRWVTWLPVDWWSKCKTGEWRGCLWIDRK